MGKYYCPPETKQRVLAVLYINDGQITDDRGHAISRMHRLMVSPPKLSSFRTTSLTQNLKDSLTPEQWDKLVREAPKP